MGQRLEGIWIRSRALTLSSLEILTQAHCLICRGHVGVS